MSAQNPIGTTGAEWSAIVAKNRTNEFAASFAANPVLEASVLSGPCVGVEDIASFFGATTSGMYESLVFTNETVDGRKTYLEWEGKAFGKDVGRTTILTRDEAGLIQSIRLYHRPLQIVVQFAQELAKRLKGKSGPGPISIFETARGIQGDSFNTHETARWSNRLLRPLAKYYSESEVRLNVSAFATRWFSSFSRTSRFETGVHRP